MDIDSKLASNDSVHISHGSAGHHGGTALQLIGPEASYITAQAESTGGSTGTQVTNEGIDIWEHHLE